MGRPEPARLPGLFIVNKMKGSSRDICYFGQFHGRIYVTHPVMAVINIISKDRWYIYLCLFRSGVFASTNKATETKYQAETLIQIGICLIGVSLTTESTNHPNSSRTSYPYSTG